MSLNVTDKIEILIVDDNLDICEIFAELFRDDGFLPSISHGGREAFELLQAKRFPVIVSDFSMPGGNGGELFLRIKQELDYQPKCFLVSSHVDFDHEKLRELGVIKVFDKTGSIDLFSLVVAAVRESLGFK